MLTDLLCVLGAAVSVSALAACVTVEDVDQVVKCVALSVLSGESVRVGAEKDKVRSAGASSDPSGASVSLL